LDRRQKRTTYPKTLINLAVFCWPQDASQAAYGSDLQRLEEEEQEEGGESTPLTKAQIIQKAVLFLIVGTVCAASFADPLVDSVNGFSTASRIPSFFISFVLLPLASSASDGISSLLFAARKSKRIMSLTYSQVSCCSPELARESNPLL
jgi:Ca2+/Na+ antiporter